MKCKIDDKNLLNWSRMITTLTSVGDEEVHFAFTDSSLTLTVFNASLSGSATCTFFNTFFQSFTIPRGYVKTFKLPAKCIMKPFRSTRFIKSCAFCEIAFEDDKDTIVITMCCKSNTEIKYTIQLLDNSDELHTDADPDNLANWIRTDPKFMISNLNNFSHGKGLVDLTIKAQGNNILMKNCATDLMRKENKIYTELTLSTLAFDRFAINEDTEVTFQLRDFKSFISLADHMKLAMTIHFHGAQDPVIVCVKSEQLEAQLMLATKYAVETESGSVNSSQASSSAMSTGISNVSSNGHLLAPPRPPPKATVTKRTGGPSRSKNDKNNGPEIIPRVAEITPEIIPRVAEITPELVHGIPEEALPLPHLVAPLDEHEPVLPVSEPFSRREAPKRKENRSSKQNPSDENGIEGREHESVENMPPPRKRMRDLLAKMTAPYDIYKKFPGHDIVLVEASDEEDDDDPNSPSYSRRRSNEEFNII